MSRTAEVSDLMTSLREALDGRLSRSVPSRPPRELYEPARYVMDAPGKRFRPLLVLLATGMHGGDVDDALPGAVAVELFHNFTLVHDDIMDRADTRRGRATVHTRWDEPTAVLVGDLLYGMAYGQLTESPPQSLPRLLRIFNETIHALCSGQILDMGFERRGEVTVQEYLAMIDQKTGALLSCALELGAAVAGASEAQGVDMRELGLEMGRAFQIQDDLLDLTADDARWGKRVGGDILEGKRTYLLLLARERAAGEDARFFDRIMGGEAEESDIPEARDRMQRLGVLEESRRAVSLYSDAAAIRIANYPDSVYRAAIMSLVDRFRSRAH